MNTPLSSYLSRAIEMFLRKCDCDKARWIPWNQITDEMSLLGCTFCREWPKVISKQIFRRSTFHSQPTMQFLTDHTQSIAPCILPAPPLIKDRHMDKMYHVHVSLIKLFCCSGCESSLHGAGDGDDGLAGQDGKSTGRLPGWNRRWRRRSHSGQSRRHDDVLWVIFAFRLENVHMQRKVQRKHVCPYRL